MKGRRGKKGWEKSRRTEEERNIGKREQKKRKGRTEEYSIRYV